MAEIRTAPVFVLTLQVGGMQEIGATPGGNRIAVGTGRRPPEGPIYEVFEVL